MEEELEKDMTPKLIKELGFRFATKRSVKRCSYGLYECQYCGKEWECRVSSIKRKINSTRSCGCQRGISTIHGLANHRFYDTWNKMLDRCNNTKSLAYQYYGGRGIIVCEEWLDVRNFIVWAEATHPNIEGYTLDRIDNDKGYSPDNCRWADKTTQALNQGVDIRNTSGFSGVSYYASAGKWIAELSIKYKKVRIGGFKTKEEAALARDQYIIDNGLPHKLSTDYTK